MTPNFPGPLEAHELRQLFGPMIHPLIPTMPDPETLTVAQIRSIFDTCQARQPDPRLSYPRHLRDWLSTLLRRIDELEKKEGARESATEPLATPSEPLL